MDWARLKNGLILLFLALNLFLGASLFLGEQQKRQIEDELLEHTLAVLERNGGSINRLALPEERSVVRGYYADLSAYYSGEAGHPGAEGAARLLGSLSAPASQSESGAVGGYFEGERGSLLVQGQSQLEFSGSFHASGGLFVSSEAAYQAQQFGKTLGPEGADALVLSVQPLEESAHFEVHLLQQLEGLPLAQHELFVLVEEDRVIAAQGQWMMEAVEPYEHLRLADPLNAILKVPGALGQSPFHIEAVTLSYVLQKEQFLDIFLPVWAIESAGQTLYFDAFSGEQISL